MTNANAAARDHGPADGLPRGLSVVLAEQRTGFWGRPGDGAAQPEFSDGDIPSRIFTFEPWLGCLWGTSCTFCYVPNLSLGHYPGGREGNWFKDWGRWLVPKPNITARLRHQLFDKHGGIRPKYIGAFVFMSAKTDPFLPRPDLLRITRANLEVFAEADVFLMCQTRSPAVVEDPEIFALLRQMAKQKKAAVSFSIPTDIRIFQRRIERGGSSPERRLRTMARLKTAGIFVSAAVSPLMPYSAEFAASLIECASRFHSGVTALGFRLGHPAARFDRSTPISPRLQATGR